MTFSDVEDSFAQKEEVLIASSMATLSSTTSTTTEYFSAISSDDDDDFFDIQTDTEREDEPEDSKSIQVLILQFLVRGRWVKFITIFKAIQFYKSKRLKLFRTVQLLT